MKRIMMLLILLVVAVAALVAYSFVLPPTCVVERSIVLGAPPEKVFSYLNNPTQWEKWSAWTKQQDPAIVHMYGGPMVGAGARHNWISDKYGSGKRVFTECNFPLMLTYEQTITGEAETTAGEMLLEKVTEGTRIVWRHTTNFEDNVLARYRSAWCKYKSDKELQQGLAGLEALLQQTDNKSASK